MLKEAVDMRGNYANKLRALADMVEQSQVQPCAARIYIFWKDPLGTVTNLCKEEPGSNMFCIAGALMAGANQALERSKGPPLAKV